MQSRKKFFLAIISGISIAAISPMVYSALKYYIALYWSICQDTFYSILNFNIAGYYMPWRYILLLVLLFMIYAKFKLGKKFRSKEPDEINTSPVLVSGKTLLEIHNASRDVQELSKRLESVEKTNHLIMKQMEATTKCLTQILQDGPSKKNNNAKEVSMETHI